MANPSKQKGTSAETAVVRYLLDEGFLNARRNVLQGAKDPGDIGGLGVAIEVKNCREMSLAQWVDEAVVEAQNVNKFCGVVWHKRRGKASPADWYVTMRGSSFAALMKFVEDVI